MRYREDTASRLELRSWVWLAVLVYCAIPYAARAADGLARFAEAAAPAGLVPGAERLGAFEGTPPVAPAYRGDELIGYVFLNSDFANAGGYSGRPIHILVGLDPAGAITGAELVEHHEPIVLVGISEARIRKVLDAYVGLNVADFARGRLAHEVDIVSGATVTVMVMDDSILRAAIKVARRYGLGGLAPEPARRHGRRMIVDGGLDTVEDWQTLLGDGSVRRLNLTVADVNQAFVETGDEAAMARPEEGEADEDFVDIYGAVVSVPAIGRSLLGDAEHANLRKRLGEGESAVLVMGRGRYSFKGSGYVRGGVFDRFQIIQGDDSIRFRDRDHKRLAEVVAAGAPRFREVDLFVIPEDAAFDPAEAWRLELLIARATGATSKAFLTVDMGYQTPPRYLKPDPTAPGPVRAAMAGFGTPDAPLWQRLWRDKSSEAVVLVFAIALLTCIFFFQDTLVENLVLTERIRLGFMIFTLVGIGWYAGAQLSVVNVMTFANALITEFRWTDFLMEPLIFLLWCSVAASLLFWGRGPFCGWLCPFGALQELMNKAAKALKVPQVQVPWRLHERLWPIKYLIFLALFGVSFYSLALAEQMAEVEPFKTAIVLKFARDWPFVLFAALVLLPGLFIERFYCRYLCPLGAALAIPGRLRMFEWLKRYRECGAPCQRCAKDCMVQAIHPEGHINPNECLYCLNCQTLYWDDKRCPVMIEKRLRRERRLALASQSMTGGPTPVGPPKQT